MTMNSSGPISLAGTTAGVSIQIENGGNGTTQISLNDTAVRSLAGVPSGAITMPTNFYGKSNQFSFAISANQTAANLRTLAVAAGWNQSSAVVATVNSGIVITSTSTGTAGLTINGSWPGGVTLVNNGQIGGKGGAGGGSGGVGGGGGGPAISLGVNVTITNNSYIGGGGGGGGGSGNAGGGGGAGNGAKGTGSPDGGSGGNVMPGVGGSAASGYASGGNGTAGGGGGSGGNSKTQVSTSGAGGSAGNPGGNADFGGYYNAAGGGGGWGASGGAGYCYPGIYPAGGAGGKAIALNGFTATRNGSGTTYGAVS